MGLVLFSVMLFFGAIGKPPRAALSFLLVTAVILTILSFGGISESRICDSGGCTLLSAAAIFIINLIVGTALYGAGRFLFARYRKSRVTD